MPAFADDADVLAALEAQPHGMSTKKRQENTNII